ncbi:MAG TPA: hypothetical protein VF216_00715 [Mizugakiibacter sp.]
MPTCLRPARAIFALLFLLPLSATAASPCKVADLMPAFWRALASQAPAAELRRTVVKPHPELYNAVYVDLPSGEAWTRNVERDVAYVGAHRAEVEAAAAYLRANVPAIMAGFGERFAGFRCDFTFYIAPTFGHMDGSAAYIDGQHRIVFAPDVIPRYHALADLKLLIDHETFHVYHHQRTGVFGASPEAVPQTLNALWSEGLATYVSWRMNPQASLDTALLQPGIPQGAQPHLAAIAADLLAHLDQADETVFTHYFVAGRQPPGYPPRAGYYVGVLVAQQLAKQYSLPQLAALNGDALRAQVATALRELAAPRRASEAAIVRP